VTRTGWRTVTAGVLLTVAIGQSQKTLTLTEQDRAVENVREYALHYWQGLPGYVCLQVTDRDHWPTPVIFKTEPQFRAKQIPDEIKKRHYTDAIEEELTFANGRERYKVLRINDKATTVKHEQLGSTLSSREFATLPERILDPKSGTKLQWVRFDKLRGGE